MFADPGSRLASARVSIDVFRAAVLSIVLTLAAGPNATLLCAVLCHPEATAGPCEHRDPTGIPSITSNGSCPDIATAQTAFVREDVRRTVSSSGGQAAAVVQPFQYLPPPKSSMFVRETGQHPPLEARPLILALRI